jgi:hypothetical protein
MARYCVNCGTEVDDSAAFCPTCGQPIDATSEVELPPAPAWPEQPAQEQQPPPPVEAARETGQPPVDEWAQTEEVPPAAPPSRAAPPPPAAPVERSAPQPVEREPAPRKPDDTAGRGAPALPITWPVMLSGWLLGVGAALAALGAAVGLFSPSMNPWDVVFLVLFLGVAYSVFFTSTMPALPHLRLITLVIVLVGLGIALDRLGFGVGQVGSVLLLLGTAAAAIGALLVELGRDQPLGGGQA